jgi:hypothetical protein
MLLSFLADVPVGDAARMAKIADLQPIRRYGNQNCHHTVQSATNRKSIQLTAARLEAPVDDASRVQVLQAL